MALRVTKSSDGHILLNGKILVPASWAVEPESGTGEPVTDRQAFEFLRVQGCLRNIVVGIIGPRDATKEQLNTAEKVAHSLGGLGITLICGGKSGVMEAASKGCSDAGGLMIGLLPGSEPDDCNSYVGVPLPTGLGEARNMIIAKSARVLIAVGGSYGTLSEVAYGLHFSKTVIGIEGAADVDGVVHVEGADDAVNEALRALLASASSTECKKSDRGAS